MSRRGSSLIRLLVAAIVVGYVTTEFARAQAPSAASQAQERASITSEIPLGAARTSLTSAEGLAPASPSDSDIGDQVVLQPQDEYDPFTAYAGTDFYWTSNAELLNDTAGSDAFFTTTAGVNYLPSLGNNLFADFAVEGSIFRYARNAGLDFNAFSLAAGLVYVIPDFHNVTLFANYRYSLLTNRAFNREIYHDHTLTGGVRKSFALSRAQQFYTALAAEFSLGGEPAYSLRHDFAWFLGYQADLTRAVKLDLYYRLAVQPYRYADRTDLNQLIGGGLSFGITRWLSVQTTATLGINNSTEQIYSYFAANIGGGISVLVNF